MTDNNLQGIITQGGKVIVKDSTFNFGSSQQTSPPNIPNNLIYKGAVNFVGRENELANIHHQLQQLGKVAISAVAGMGGVGKTELATQYALKYEADYPGGICWLNARESDLAASIVQFYGLYISQEIPQELGGKLLNPQEQARWCWQHWQPSEGLVLVVLDDVTNLEHLQKIQLPANRFRVLITTRLRNLNPNFVQEIPLDVLPENQALELLTTFVGEKRIQREKTTAKQLCKWLGYLPLGLELVGKYLAEDPDLSLAEMLERLKVQQLEDEALEGKQLGVKTAFELSWRELNEKTQLVGALLSLFAPKVIPWQLVESTSEVLNWAKADVTEARKQLYKRHLIQRLEDKDACYQIHPLIREFLKGKLAKTLELKQPQGLLGFFNKFIHNLLPQTFFNINTNKDLKQAFVAAMIAKAKEIPQAITLEFIASVQDTIPHLQEVAENSIDAVKDEDLICIFVGLSRFYKAQGLYALAEPWYVQCLSIVKARLGEKHPYVATSLNNLASLYRYQGRYSEAEPLYLQALEIRKRLLGEEHPDVATSLNNLALLYYSQGRYSEAEPLYLQDIEIRKRLLGEEHPHIATSLNNLASLYHSQGRYSEAEPLHLQALAMRKRLLGEEHPHIATSLSNLALLYDSQGRYSEAEPLHLQALEISKRTLGEEHPDFATILNNLALLYNSQGRYSEAEPLYLQALEISKRTLGEEHPDVAQSLDNLANLYSSQGKYTEAQTLSLQALAIRQSLLGEEHPDLAQNLNNLANLYKSQGRYSEAEPLCLQALALYKRLLGEKHPHVATSLSNLASLYQCQGRYSEAEPLYLQALEMRKRLLGEKHPDVATSLSNLASLYESQGRYSEAEPLYLQALEMRKRLLGEENPDVATSFNNLAYLYKSQGRYNEAEPLYLQALEMRKRLLGEDHPDVATSLNNLAAFYKSQGRYSEAEPLYIHALEIFEQKLGVNHPHTVICRNNLESLRNANS